DRNPPPGSAPAPRRAPSAGTPGWTRARARRCPRPRPRYRDETSERRTLAQHRRAARRREARAPARAQRPRIVRLAARWHAPAMTTLESYDPATGELVGEVPITPIEEISRVVARARQAQPAWHALGAEGRAERLARIG